MAQKKKISEAISNSRKSALPKGPNVRRSSSNKPFSPLGVQTAAEGARTEAEQIRINAFNAEKKKAKKKK